MEKKYLTLKERICFTIGAFGRSGIYTLMSMFTLVFFQNGAGLTLKQGTTIILIGRIFDALNDPLMGMIVDKTKSRWGKMRPYLLFSPVPIAICTIMLFSAPFAEGSQAAFIWALVTYILWGVAFTVQDVPFWGLSAVITPLENERTSFISTARLGSTFGGILPALLIPILYQSNMGYTKGFFIGGVLFALLGCSLSILIFFVSKERVPKTDHTPSFKETFSVIGKNKVLIIVIFAAVLGSTMVTANQCADYIGNYLIIQNYTDFGQIFTSSGELINNVDAAAAYDFWIPRGTIVTTLTVAIGVGMVPAMAVFPLLRKKFSLKQIYQNAFYKDSILHIYNTGYLLMAESSDKGETWTPRVLNTEIKRDTETALLVSPGKGTLASDGTIIIPFYTFDKVNDKILQQASFIYSKDNGKTFKRSVDAPNGNGVEWSSESEIVEVYDGVLRMFIRNGTGKIAYIDAKWDESINDYT